LNGFGRADLAKRIKGKGDKEIVRRFNSTICGRNKLNSELNVQEPSLRSVNCATEVK
jgi:hypothetical protein